MRTVDNWVGRDDDHVPPPRVRLRVFERCGGKCGQCGRKINAGESWTLEHLIAISLGGANAEANLGVTCGWCLPAKNASDAKLKAKGARIRAKHRGIRAPSRLKSAGFPVRQPQRRATGPIVRKSERTATEI